MKRLIALIVVLFWGVFSGYAGEDSYYNYSYARLSYVNGDVYIQRAGDLGDEEGTVNLVIIEGDKIGTREGRAEIHLGRKNYLRLDSFAQLDFAGLPRQGADLAKLLLLAGRAYLRINSLEREKDFEIHTPDASFYILEEGLYRFEVDESKETELLVINGAVEAAGEEGSVVVEAGERLVASRGHFDESPGYAYEEDSFSRWNNSRDALYARYVNRRYLPSEIYEYEDELDYYGTWAYESPYGYVWVPRVYHVSWRPYFYGRWVWYPVIGWTWVSSEPWGWCVYHYGRWHWRLGLGWYWIPTRAWGPAWVHWYAGYDYVGWSPLSYYNYPVVIINNHFYDRYSDSYYPLLSRALTVIHKTQLQSRHVAKVALAQTEVSRLGKINLSAKQPNVRTVVNRSGLQRATAKRVKAYSSGRASSSGSISTTKIRKSSSSSSSRQDTQDLNSKARIQERKSLRQYSRDKEKEANPEYSTRVRRTEKAAKGDPSSSDPIRENSRSLIKSYSSKRTSGSASSGSFRSSSSRSAQTRVRNYSSARPVSPNTPSPRFESSRSLPKKSSSAFSPESKSYSGLKSFSRGSLSSPRVKSGSPDRSFTSKSYSRPPSSQSSSSPQASRSSSLGKRVKK